MTFYHGNDIGEKKRKENFKEWKRLPCCLLEQLVDDGALEHKTRMFPLHNPSPNQTDKLTLRAINMKWTSNVIVSEKNLIFWDKHIFDLASSKIKSSSSLGGNSQQIHTNFSRCLTTFVSVPLALEISERSFPSQGILKCYQKVREFYVASHRMHSSRMRTARSLTASRSICGR